METESKVSRRKLLLVAGGVAAAGAFVASPGRDVIARGARKLVSGGSGAQRIATLASASYEQWLGQVGSVFAAGGGVRLSLTGVVPMPAPGARPAGLRDGAFAAVFDPVGGATLAGDLIYTLSHARHGPVQIFLSAAADPRTPARLFAIFN